MKKHIFNAGPAILPDEVLQQASKSVFELDAVGMSILEVSHRGKEFAPIIEQAQQMILELLGLDDSYAVLFLQGGASMQFCMIPYNLLGDKDTAGYMDTGRWAANAIKEAKTFGIVEVPASSVDKNYSYIPKGFTIKDSYKYFHITTNNTVAGTQMHDIPECPVPLVADMSSDIFSRQLDFSKFSLIYAGAQKNLGPAGVTLVILKKDLAGKLDRKIPTMLNYQTHIDKGSLFNTPPVFAVYVCYLTLQWLKAKGGIASMEKINKEKAKKLYDEIDSNPLFKGIVAKEDRSLMNVVFKMTNEDLEEDFINEARAADIVGIKGHRSVGGLRASLYNALPMDSVNVLVDLMLRYAEKHG